MHVGLNLVWLTPGRHGGLEVYARELVARLAERDDVRLTAFVNNALGPWPGVPSELVPVTPARRVEWVRGEQLLLPRAAARAGCELVHSLASTAPLRGRFRRVTTIHDLNYRIVPQAHLGLLGLGMRILVPLAARRSARIIVPAAATGEDLRRLLGVDSAKIDVVHEGLGARQRVNPMPEEQLRAWLDAGRRAIALSVCRSGSVVVPSSMRMSVDRLMPLRLASSYRLNSASLRRQPYSQMSSLPLRGQLFAMGSLEEQKWKK